MEVFLAHAGHWAIYVLYSVPIVIVLGSIAVSVLRGRRQQRAGGEHAAAQRSE